MTPSEQTSTTNKIDIQFLRTHLPEELVNDPTAIDMDQFFNKLKKNLEKIASNLEPTITADRAGELQADQTLLQELKQKLGAAEQVISTHVTLAGKKDETWQAEHGGAAAWSELRRIVAGLRAKLDQLSEDLTWSLEIAQKMKSSQPEAAVKEAPKKRFRRLTQPTSEEAKELTPEVIVRGVAHLGERLARAEDKIEGFTLDQSQSNKTTLLKEWAAARDKELDEIERKMLSLEKLVVRKIGKSKGKSKSESNDYTWLGYHLALEAQHQLLRQLRVRANARYNELKAFIEKYPDKKDDQVGQPKGESPVSKPDAAEAPVAADNTRELNKMLLDRFREAVYHSLDEWQERLKQVTSGSEEERNRFYNQFFDHYDSLARTRDALFAKQTELFIDQFATLSKTNKYLNGPEWSELIASVNALVHEGSEAGDDGSVAPAGAETPPPATKTRKSVLQGLLGMLGIGPRKGPATPAAATPPEVTILNKEAIGSPEAQPIVDYYTTYEAGQNLYDDSFSIDTSDGEFLGECGVGIGLSEQGPNNKQVKSFEVWLFDKNDINTQSKIVASPQASETERAVASTQGASDLEVVEIQNGQSLTLETNTLRLVATFSNIQTDENGIFTVCTTNLKVYPKDGSSTAPIPEVVIDEDDLSAAPASTPPSAPAETSQTSGKQQPGEPNTHAATGVDDLLNTIDNL